MPRGRKPDPALIARNESIVAMRARGDSIKVIAGAFELTGSMIRLIVQKAKRKDNGKIEVRS